MCKSELHPFIASLPKVEHHMHLEGALSPSLFFTLCQKNSIDLPMDPSYASLAALNARYNSFTSLDDFLSYYYTAMSALRVPSDFEALALSYFEIAHAQNVKHAELFFDPQAHTSRGVPYASVVEGFTAAVAIARQRYGISCLLIPCFLRHLPVADAEETFAQLKPDLKAGRLAGVGLDSSEKGFPPDLFKGVFESAEREGVRRTAHAGEECGAESVRDALRELRIERVDHGRAIAQDRELMKEVAEKQTLVTLCPLSNVCLKGVGSVGEMPIRAFLEAGVRFSINSDDPAYFAGYILENYCAVQEAFSLSREEWKGIVRGSIEGSWCEGKRKDELKVMLDACG